MRNELVKCFQSQLWRLLIDFLFSLSLSSPLEKSGLRKPQRKADGAMVRASHCGGFSCCGAQASVVSAQGLGSFGPQALTHRLNSCGA